MNEIISNTLSTVIAGIICQIIFYTFVVLKNKNNMSDEDVLKMTAFFAYGGFRILLGLVCSILFSIYFSSYIFSFLLMILFKLDLNILHPNDNLSTFCFIVISIFHIIYINYRIIFNTTYVGLRDLLLNYLKASGAMLFCTIIFVSYLFYQSDGLNFQNHQFACGFWIYISCVYYYMAVIQEEDF